MHHLTPAGQQVVSDLAARHGVSTDAVTHMLFAVLNGQGSMAQFSHPEFGGSGQWMRGGMTMVGDMFNYGLKNRVDNLCAEISNILNDQPGLLRTGSFQSQNQSSGGMSSGAMPIGANSLFVPDPRSQWYPAELGTPNSSGSQNNARYAYFGNSRRLAVDVGGDIAVYDTLDHQIGGFSQQQGSGGSITFTSQYGTVNLSSLPMLSRNGQPVVATPQRNTFSNPAPAPQNNPPSSQAPVQAPAQGSVGSDAGSILAALEKLGDLKAKGIVSDEEFASKKADLLSRL